MDTFDLGMRFLNGDVEWVQVAPNTPIEELLARVAKTKGLPEFHGFTLITGDRELRAGSVAEAGFSQGSEVQLIATRMHEKAVAKLNEKMLEARIEYQETDDRFLMASNLHCETRPALEFLEALPDLEPPFDLELFEIFDEFLGDFEKMYHDVCGPMVVDECLRRWGTVFGRACAYPEAFIPRLVKKFIEFANFHPNFSFPLSALYEIDARSGHEFGARYGGAFRGHEPDLMCVWICIGLRFLDREIHTIRLPHAEITLPVAAHLIKNFVHLQAAAAYAAGFELARRKYRGSRLLYPFFSREREAENTSKLIGLAKHVQDRSTTSPPHPPEARAARGTMRARTGGVSTVLVGGEGAPAVAARRRSRSRGDSESQTPEHTKTDQGLDEALSLSDSDSQAPGHAETDQGLDVALNLSEAEALQQEQENVQLALMRSKADQWCPVVIFQFSQSKEWMRRALLDGPELKEERDALRDAGFSSNLPSGAKIFVPPEFYRAVLEYLDRDGWDFKSSQVIFIGYLEEKILAVVEAARKDTTVRERGGSCKLTSRVHVEVDLTDDDVSEALAEPDDETPTYIVKRTFVEVPGTTPNSLRSASSFRFHSV